MKKKPQKTRGYDEFYKARFDKKKFMMTAGLLLVFVALIAIVFIAIIFFQKINKTPDDNPLPPVIITEEQKYYAELQNSLSNGYTIGVTTKEDVINAGSVKQEISGDNYLIKNTYSTINNNDYFTTYLFKDNVLVGIVHEAMVDTGTKYSLNTKFQTLSSDLNKAYSDISISKRWFTEPIKYDGNAWNDMLINNELELVAELAKDSEFIKVIASGVPYFDYMHENEYDQSFGNLVIIYSNGTNQDLFKDIDKMSF